jgi:hypothetical protein
MRLRRTLLPLCLPSLALAQVNASYAPFGAGCPGTGSGLGTNHVVPAAMAQAFGGSNNIIPFTASPMKYQQVFLGADLPVPFRMAGLSLRQDESGAGHRVIVDLEIHVGFTTRTPQTIGATFADNFDAGAPVAVVPRTQVTFPDTPLPPTHPSDFFFTIPWDTTFDWVPAAGRNFLVQVTIWGNSHGGPWSYPLDATSLATTRVYGSPPTAATGTVHRNYGLVMGLRAPTDHAVPVLWSTSTPQIGDTFRVRLAHARATSAAVLALGASDTRWAGVPLPLDLGWLGAPGCRLLVSVDHAQPEATDAGGSASVVYDLPNSIYLLGGRFYNQYLVFDPPANAMGFALSNGGAGVVGNM